MPCPPPGDLLNPGIESKSHTSLALAGRFFTTSEGNFQMNEIGGHMEQIKINKQPHVFYFVLRALALEGNKQGNGHASRLVVEAVNIMDWVLRLLFQHT